jgi:hypothetical protein
MNKTQLVKNLLDWNRQNLLFNSGLTKNKIAEIFADSFQVKANGRHYGANHDNYFEFLNQMRSTIKSIQYDCHEFIDADTKIIVPMTVTIAHVDNRNDIFEAMLIVQFNENEKVILWEEVYTKIS